MAYYRMVLLVKAAWEDEAEQKARYTMVNKIENKPGLNSMFLFWGATIYSKQQVKDNKKPNSGVIMEDDTEHLGIFRANSKDARVLIDRYSDIEYLPFGVWFDENEHEEENEYKEEIDYEYVNEEGQNTTVLKTYERKLHLITDRNDPRLTSRDYFVVPFGVHC